MSRNCVPIFDNNTFLKVQIFYEISVYWNAWFPSFGILALFRSRNIRTSIRPLVVDWLHRWLKVIFKRSSFGGEKVVFGAAVRAKIIDCFSPKSFLFAARILRTFSSVPDGKSHSGHERALFFGFFEKSRFDKFYFLPFQIWRDFDPQTLNITSEHAFDLRKCELFVFILRIFSDAGHVLFEAVQILSGEHFDKIDYPFNYFFLRCQQLARDFISIKLFVNPHSNFSWAIDSCFVEGDTGGSHLLEDSMMSVQKSSQNQ